MGARNPRHRDGSPHSLGPLNHSLRFVRSLDRQVRDLWRGPAMVGCALDCALHRYDNLAVAAFSGSAALGLYNQAYLVAEGERALRADHRLSATEPVRENPGQSARVQPATA